MYRRSIELQGNLAKPMLSDVVFRPMLFSMPMVQALLNGTKTQTRRLVNVTIPIENFEETLKKSILKVGSIIWVRETFAETCDEMGTPIIAYKFGKPRIITGCNGKYELWKETDTDWSIDNYPSCGKWKPSLFMPKYACRIFLEVTEIRIERLNEISDSDAIEEGIEYSTEFGYKLYSKNSFFSKHISASDSYMSLWELINGQGSWRKNPFVWVYKFKRLNERPSDFL